MRMPRMTVRRWMMLVGVAAVIAAVARCVERRAFYLHMAARYRPDEHFYGLRRNEKLRDGIHYRYNLTLFTADGVLKEENVKPFEKLHKHYAALIAKYRYAADHPWIYVEPDPPEPSTSDSG
jgi:hypothetical protein